MAEAFERHGCISGFMSPIGADFHHCDFWYTPPEQTRMVMSYYYQPHSLTRFVTHDKFRNIPQMVKIFRFKHKQVAIFFENWNLFLKIGFKML